ncbi:DUF4998 domain-containing protein [Niabella yanshanensis]|uniref:DUF4998 domain-containing protein n=1 Tax=Niabella yanshanensis TaxID=577386 RepID=A0ABZ0W5Y7_9BACT|nr:DUF4998 domain-containing protein [Niabella yanshanensis]WQD38536.1 DUF4998 domain-containing protein [Niabella yanshanensis]
MIRSLYVAMLLVLCACSKSESQADVIPGKVEALNIYPGKERVRIELSFSDPGIEYFDVYWKGRSLSKRIHKDEAVNRTVTSYIEQLNEGYHTFDVVAYNAGGKTSAAVQAQCMVYGEAYLSGLNNPLARDIVFIRGSIPYIEWNELEGDAVAINIDYTTAAGTAQRVRVIKGMSTVSLPGYKQLSEVAYQTQYLPGQNSIDTFAAPKQIIPFLTQYANHTLKNIIEKSGLVNRVISQTGTDIHPDVEYTRLQFENGSGAAFSLFALGVDLSKGNTSLTTLMPDNATQFGLQTVKTMAERRDVAGGKIIAAVNADFFDWSPVSGRPWGPVVVEEAVVKNFIKEGIGVTTYFGVKKDGSLSIDLTSSLSAADYNSFSNMTGGGTNLLYLRGAPRVYNDVVREPRTMIGYTSDKKVYLVLVDGRRPGYSVGMTIDELIAVMKSLGIYSATNLDGGGSSTMVLKNNNGAFEVVNRYSDASPRAVANAIAIKLK